MDVTDIHLLAENELHQQHLLAELARIDLLIKQEVYRWNIAGQDPKDDYRGLYLSGTTAQALTDLPFGTSWGQAVNLSAEQSKHWSDLQLKAVEFSRLIKDEIQQRNQTSRLEHLNHEFGLDCFDIDAILICLAPALDLHYEKIYGYLQDDITHKRPRVNLILDLLSEPGPGRLEKLGHFSDQAPLLKHHLLEFITDSGTNKSSLLGQTVCVDEAIVSWLLGKYQLSALLQPHTTYNYPHLDATDELLAGENLEQLEITMSEKTVLVFSGPDQLARQAAARLISARGNRPLLSVNLASVIANQESPYQIINLGLRDAQLTSSVLLLDGWDALLNDNITPDKIISELYTYPGMMILSGEKTWLPRNIARDCRIRFYEFPIPSYTQRRALWQHFLSNNMVNQDVALSRLDVDSLASQFLLTSGQIRDAIASASDASFQMDTLLSDENLFYAARAHSNPHLSSLARKIEPRYSWADIVLPQDQLSMLKEIVDTIRHRSLVLEDWGLGQKLVSSRGVTALFAGPAGTGKTMSAEVMAGELGLDLYKIDLSTVVSKYVGETEKNLERIFSEAESSNAILFFDEADALFGKRSEVRDAHDRYANIEISYLLQRMEAYNGVTILATNLRSNLDEAFTRRLQFAVDFPFPEEADRLRIWQTLFPTNVPRSAEVDLPLLARRFKLAGGNIRNVIVSAAYLAASNGGVVRMEHLLHGTRRELQKMGKLVGENDLQLI